MAPYEALMPLAPWERVEVLQEALESLRAQSLPPARLVISADGTPPFALRNALEASGLPFTLIIGPGGEGVGPVLARGLMACQEDLVVRIDADDVSLPERCQIQVEVMSGQRELVALSGPIVEFIDDVSHPCGMRKVPVSAVEILRRSRWRNPLNHPAIVLRRAEILALGNYRDCPGFEDYDLWLRVLKHKGAVSLGNLSHALVYARVGPDHLARRRGVDYAIKELRFLIQAGKDDLLSWPRVCLLLMLRLPPRLFLPNHLALVMRFLRKRVKNEGQS